MPSGAYATRILDDLEECGFIRKYNMKMLTYVKNTISSFFYGKYKNIP